MSNIAAKLDKLETIFKETNAPILQHFNPGLPEKEIKMCIFYLIVFCFVSSIAFGQDSINQHYSIKFSSQRSDLSKQAKLTLDTVALLMKRQPILYCRLIKYCQTENQKDNIATWDRASKTIIYLITKGIDQNHFYFNYGADNSNCNTIDFLFTTEKVDQPLPHPELPQKNNR